MRKIESDYTEQPDFLLAEIPIKNGSIHDDRLWVYCNKAASLIEFILQDYTVDLKHRATSGTYEYTDLDGYTETWIGVYIQDNCALLGIDPKENAQAAWSFLTNYFEWEENEDDFI